MSAYEALFRTPRWQATQGKDFVFVDPHPGFAAGKAVQSLWGSHCGTMQNATQLIAEMPLRRRCGKHLAGMCLLADGMDA